MVSEETSLTLSGIVDLHADLPFDIVKRRQAGEHQVLERCHLEKLRKGSVTTVIAAIWVESSYKPNGAIKRGLQIADAFLEDLKESQSFRLVENNQELLDSEAQGRTGLILGVEGGEIIDGDLGLLRVYHKLGVRCFGFVWNQRNLLADGWDHAKDDMGLTEFGRETVKELDRLRIVLDLSHMTPKSFDDALDAAGRPVIVSHTCTSLNGPSRGRSDDQLRAVGNNHGIVGIFAVNSGTGTAAIKDLKQYCDHVQYATKVAGVEHVGLGPDFYDYFVDDLDTDYPDSAFRLVEGLEDHTRLNAVLSELSARGMSDEEVRMIARDNFVRVFREVVG